jgi:hypothetical protein
MACVAERTLETRYRLLAAGFSDAPSGEAWRARLGGRFRPALEILVSALARDLGCAPPDLDRERIHDLLVRVLPGRLSGEESFTSEMVDFLEEFLLFVVEAEGLTTGWEWTSSIAESREEFAVRLRDPGREHFAPPPQRPDRRPAAKIGRNDPCPCGSGRKYKQCCLRLG